MMSRMRPPFLPLQSEEKIKTKLMNLFARVKGHSQHDAVHVIADTHDNTKNDTIVPRLSHHSVPFAQIVQSVKSTQNNFAAGPRDSEFQDLPLAFFACA
jgi:hypothetical protein